MKRSDITPQDRFANWAMSGVEPYTSIGPEMHKCIDWKGHWKKTVYIEINTRPHFVWETELDEASVWFRALWVDRNQRQHGHATQMLKRLQLKMRHFGCTMFIFPDGFDWYQEEDHSPWKYGMNDDYGGHEIDFGPMSGPELTAFYSRLGFKRLRIQSSVHRPGSWRPRLLDEQGIRPYIQVGYDKDTRRLAGSRPMAYAGNARQRELVAPYLMDDQEIEELGPRRKVSI